LNKAIQNDAAKLRKKFELTKLFNTKIQKKVVSLQKFKTQTP